MRLFLRWKDILKKLSGPLVSEFEQLVERLNAWATVEHLGTGAHGDVSVTGFNFKGTTSATVGAAGGASALPATPTGYLVIQVDGTDYKVPYYAE